jgi:hypothetical protein
MPSLMPDESRIRITIFSPKSVGKVLTRKSIAFDFDRTIFIRPSCGTRFSEMSSLEMTLIREASLSLMMSGGCAISISTPSSR